MLVYYHVLIPVFSAIAMNVIIYAFGWNKNMKRDDDLPPGYIIGTIWTVIFALLGYVHYRLYTLKNKTNFGSASVVLFILFSLAYPALISSINGCFLNFISLILSFALSLIVMMYSRHIFLFMIPLLVWVSFVNLALYDVYEK